MSNKIQVTTTGQIMPGEYVAAPDFDQDTEPELLADYKAEDQQWLEVKSRGGHADIGWLEVKEPWGEEPAFRVPTSWEQWIWRLADEDGKPIRADD